jgi:hypothetical protein
VRNRWTREIRIRKDAMKYDTKKKQTNEPTSCFMVREEERIIVPSSATDSLEVIIIPKERKKMKEKDKVIDRQIDRWTDRQIDRGERARQDRGTKH